MLASRKYNEMTAEEKRRSVELWKKFYQSLQEKNYEASWTFWNERLEYLNNIGVSAEKVPEGNEIFLDF